MTLKASKTKDNLKAAFAGESQANRRYLYFAAKADVVIPLDVSFRREIQITPVCLRLSGKCIFEVLFCFTPFECHITVPITELLKNFCLR